MNDKKLIYSGLIIFLYLLLTITILNVRTINPSPILWVVIITFYGILLWCIGYLFYLITEKNLNKALALFFIFSGLYASILLYSVYGSEKFGLSQKLFQLSGFSTLSLTRADLSSQSPYFRGENVWILTVTQGKLSQSAYLRLEPDDVLAKTGKDKPESDIELRIDYTKQQCEYPIQANPSAPNIYEFYMNEWTCWVAPSTEKAREHCPSGLLFTYGKYSGLLKCVCVGANPLTNAIADIYGANIHTILQTSVTNLDTGESESTVLDTVSDKTFGPLGDKAYVVWQGNLDTGKSCENKYPPWAYKGAYFNGQWRVIDATAYNNYADQYNFYYGKTWTSHDELYQAVNILNTLGSQALVSKPIGDIEGSTTSGTLIIPIQDIYQYPVLTYYIKADWIGIYTAAPEPSILNTELTPACFQTGDTSARILVEVKNIGKETGVFEVYAVCPPPFYSTESKDISLGAGQSSVVSLPITASVNAHTIDSCTVYVHGVGYTKSRTVKVCSDPLPTSCTPNQFRCKESLIMKCNSEGTFESVYKDCSPKKCVYEEINVPKCEGEKPPVTKCENCFAWLMNKIKPGTCTPVTPKKVLGFIPTGVSQNLICPFILIGVTMSSLMFVLIIVIILKKKGVIKK